MADELVPDSPGYWHVCSGCARKVPKYAEVDQDAYSCSISEIEDYHAGDTLTFCGHCGSELRAFVDEHFDPTPAKGDWTVPGNWPEECGFCGESDSNGPWWMISIGVTEATSSDYEVQSSLCNNCSGVMRKYVHSLPENAHAGGEFFVPRQLREVELGEAATDQHPQKVYDFMLQAEAGDEFEFESFSAATDDGPGKYIVAQARVTENSKHALGMILRAEPLGKLEGYYRFEDPDRFQFEYMNMGKDADPYTKGTAHWQGSKTAESMGEVVDVRDL